MKKLNQLKHLITNKEDTNNSLPNNNIDKLKFLIKEDKKNKKISSSLKKLKNNITDINETNIVSKIINEQESLKNEEIIYNKFNNLQYRFNEIIINLKNNDLYNINTSIRNNFKKNKTDNLLLNETINEKETQQKIINDKLTEKIELTNENIKSNANIQESVNLKVTNSIDNIIQTITESNDEFILFGQEFQKLLEYVNSQADTIKENRKFDIKNHNDIVDIFNEFVSSNSILIENINNELKMHTESIEAHTKTNKNSILELKEFLSISNKSTKNKIHKLQKEMSKQNETYANNIINIVKNSEKNSEFKINDLEKRIYSNLENIKNQISINNKTIKNRAFKDQKETLKQITNIKESIKTNSIEIETLDNLVEANNNNIKTIIDKLPKPKYYDSVIQQIQDKIFSLPFENQIIELTNTFKDNKKEFQNKFIELTENEIELNFEYKNKHLILNDTKIPLYDIIKKIAIKFINKGIGNLGQVRGPGALIGGFGGTTSSSTTVTNNLFVFEDNLIKSNNVKEINFTGTGVNVITQPNNRIDVEINGISSETDVEFLELETMFKMASSRNIKIPIYDTEDRIIEIGVWLEPEKINKLYTKRITYSGENISVIRITDEISNKQLLITKTYNGDKLETLTREVI